MLEGWPSGLRRTPGKRVYPNRVTGVRIPFLPPQFRLKSLVTVHIEVVGNTARNNIYSINM